MAAALAGCDRQSDKAAQPAPSASTASVTSGIDRSKQGSALPDFTLTDPAGAKLVLASLKGKPVLINLWATWCAPCVAELPTLDKLAASGAVRVVAVSQDAAPPQKIAAFLKDKGLTRLPAWLDPDNDLSFHYNTGTLPTTVLYDSTGHEVWRFVGEQNWGSPETAKLLAEAR
jgi:thiol-disulfide isomerase/thioredoxin